MIENNNPLISIIVITYNSSKYVLETLESAKAQTYQNIELIVTDDASKDNTVEICKVWLDENRERFVRTELVTIEENTGIPANCNRGLNVANGEWVKLIAGDDYLLINCIEKFSNYVYQHNCEAVFSRMQSFHNENENHILSKTLPNRSDEKMFDLTSDEQYYYLLKKSFNIAPSSFLRRSFILNLGGFDEKYRNIEDLPLWLKITKSGCKLHFIEETTVHYRIYIGSVSNSIKPLKDYKVLKSAFEIRLIFAQSEQKESKIKLKILIDQFDFYTRFARVYNLEDSKLECSRLYKQLKNHLSIKQKIFYLSIFNKPLKLITTTYEKLSRKLR